jgi:cell division protein FtsB
MARATQTPGFSKRFLLLGLLALFLLLQGGLWLSEDGWSEVLRLRGSVETQRVENEQLTERNRRLRAEVADLKGGFAALEERARSDLGMVASDESFYVLVPGEEPVGSEPATDNPDTAKEP